MENTNQSKNGCRIGAVRFKRPENVVMFGGLTTVPHEPARILQYAMEANLKTVIVAGWDQDDKLYLAGSVSNRPEVLWLLAKASDSIIY